MSDVIPGIYIYYQLRTWQLVFFCTAAQHDAYIYRYRETCRASNAVQLMYACSLHTKKQIPIHRPPTVCAIVGGAPRSLCRAGVMARGKQMHAYAYTSVVNLKHIEDVNITSQKARV